MVFLQPTFLLLLLGLPFLWFFPRGERDPRHALLRITVLALLVLALGRPVVLSDEAPAVQVFVLDDSPSAREVRPAGSLDALCDAARRIGGDAEVRLVTIGRGALSEEQRASFDLVEELDVDVAASPLGAALSAAAELVPRGAEGAITLISDGRATDGDWAEAVQSIERRGLPVHTMSLRPLDGDVLAVELTAAGPLRVGQTARLFARVVGEAARVDLRLLGPSGELVVLEDVRCDGSTTIPLEFEPREAGFLPVSLELNVREGANRLTENDALRTTLAVDEPLRVLYLGQRMVGGDVVLADLVGRGFEVEPWQGTPLSAESLAAYDLAVLDDLPAEVLGEESQRALADAVRDGGLGLFASGGAASFGPGGYHDQPLESLLPVEFVQKEEKRDPSTTLVVIIDTSGSMGGNRVQLAKEVSRLAIRRLLPHDKVGIVEFYGAKHWAAPIQPASNAIELERALNRLDAGGGTVILPAIEEAFYGLKNVQTRYKHVLVLTDGGVESGAFEPLLRSMADDGINVSTVLIGPEAHSEFLVTLANWGKGRFYSVPNRFNLPEILLKQPASAKLPSYRPGSHLVQARGGAGWWGDVDVSSLPELAGYVETRSRPGAEVLLETTEGGHPVLGSWRVGLGRVTAFTSEPTGPGTEPWRGWEGFGPWLARVMERTASDQRAPYRTRLERRGTQLCLTAERRVPQAEAPRAKLLGEDGSLGESLSFAERAPGWYEARWVAPLEVEVRAVVEAGSGAAAYRSHLVSPDHDGVAHERHVDPSRALDLGALTAATGGEQLTPEPASLTSFAPAVGGGEAPVAVVRVWPWLVLVALLTYLFEILYRRGGLRREARA